MTSERESNAARPTPDQLRREIERTRAELGETVEQLARKADVKAQLQERRELVQRQVRDRPFPFAAAAAGIIAGVGAVWLIRRR
ncbi:MAG TPA: DUF3618 domain-containing protein [Thermoleophilaceae bacterium]|nr:DUF3618 domain-containing protein [Thermoleophilaceae bacterium]